MFDLVCNTEEIVLRSHLVWMFSLDLARRTMSTRHIPVLDFLPGESFEECCRWFKEKEGVCHFCLMKTKIKLAFLSFVALFLETNTFCVVGQTMQNIFITTKTKITTHYIVIFTYQSMTKPSSVFKANWIAFHWLQMVIQKGDLNGMHSLISC